MSLNGGQSALAEDSKRIDTLYHGTTSNRIKDIQQNGLNPNKNTQKGMGPRTEEGHNYLTYSPSMAHYYAFHKKEKTDNLPDEPDSLVSHFPKGRNQPVVLHIDRNHPSVKGLKTDWAAGNSSFKTKSHIPPEAIRKIEKARYPGNAQATDPFQSNRARTMVRPWPMSERHADEHFNTAQELLHHKPGSPEHIKIMNKIHEIESNYENPLSKKG